MIAWLFGYKSNDILDKNIKTASNYVLFTKLKEFEERLENLSVRFYQLEEENKILRKEIKRLRENDLFLNSSHKHISKVLDQCIILHPLDQK